MATEEVLAVPVKIEGQKYYRTAEACQVAGICRSTLFRWLKSGIIEETLRDRRGWRLFTENDLKSIRTEANRIRRH